MDLRNGCHRNAICDFRDCHEINACIFYKLPEVVINMVSGVTGRGERKREVSGKNLHTIMLWSTSGIAEKDLRQTQCV